MSAPNRRDVLRVAAVAAGAGLLPRASLAESTTQPADAKRRALRFCHLTDLHLMPELGAADGIAACLNAVNELRPRPAFIVTGGDLCHRLAYAAEADARQRVEQFANIWHDHTDIRTFHSLGNHDWAGAAGPIARGQPAFGQQLLKDALELDRTTYSFDAGGWHFVVLDNVDWLTQPEGYQGVPKGYQGVFDQRALAWLAGDLALNRSTPTMIVCHIPPISVLPFGMTTLRGESAWQIPFSLVTRNPELLIGASHLANVKAIVSGHLHHREDIELMGLKFICGGAVCGKWWQGDNIGCPAGFSIFDCRADGTFEHEYRSFGWVYRR